MWKRCARRPSPSGRFSGPGRAALGLATIVVTGCPVPIPRTVTRVPDLTVEVRDGEDDSPVPDAEVLLVRYAYPYARVDHLVESTTDETGRVCFTQQVGTEWVMPLMPHGVPEYAFAVAVLGPDSLVEVRRVTGTSQVRLRRWRASPPDLRRPSAQEIVDHLRILADSGEPIPPVTPSEHSDIEWLRDHAELVVRARVLDVSYEEGIADEGFARSRQRLTVAVDEIETADDDVLPAMPHGPDVPGSSTAGRVSSHSDEQMRLVVERIGARTAAEAGDRLRLYLTSTSKPGIWRPLAIHAY